MNGDYLHERLPHNKFDKVDAGHFAWADAADEYATLIIDWWKGGYERVEDKSPHLRKISAGGKVAASCRFT